jgi:hypothetical protein
MAGSRDHRATHSGADPWTRRQAEARRVLPSITPPTIGGRRHPAPGGGSDDAMSALYGQYAESQVGGDPTTQMGLRHMHDPPPGPAPPSADHDAPPADNAPPTTSEPLPPPDPAPAPENPVYRVAASGDELSSFQGRNVAEAEIVTPADDRVYGTHYDHPEQPSLPSRVMHAIGSGVSSVGRGIASAGGAVAHQLSHGLPAATSAASDFVHDVTHPPPPSPAAAQAANPNTPAPPPPVVINDGGPSVHAVPLASGQFR